MNLGSAVLNWFDLLVMVLMIVGIIQGRRRGMSEELLPVFQWLCIVVIGAVVYAPVGRLLAQSSGLPLFYANLIAYCLIAAGIKLGFNSAKRAVGEKLVQSDAFGRFEYYLGMTAGTLRCFCILLFALALLHAKFVSEADRKATARMQAENFGSISFPTLGSLQHSVFYESVSGRFIRSNLRDQLIEPTVAVAAPKKRSVGRARERAVEEVLK